MQKSFDKKVLDATCGSRMMWFDKGNPIALYVDRREIDNELIWKSKDGRREARLNIAPDVLADFTSLPFDDNTFYHVVFDPPHLIRVGDNAWIAKKYGKLESGWEKTLRAGFDECMRVLKVNGTLIFKWNEVQVPVRKIIDIIGTEPMYGHVSGKHMNTHWMAFLKEE